MYTKIEKLILPAHWTQKHLTCKKCNKKIYNHQHYVESRVFKLCLHCGLKEIERCAKLHKKWVDDLNKQAKDVKTKYVTELVAQRLG